MATDSPEQLSRFRDKYALSYTLLSDPQLLSAEAMGVLTLSKHPMSLTYPAGAFLQPAYFVWRSDGDLAHEWVQKPGLMNLYGASGRPSPEQMLEIAVEAAGG